MRPRIASTARFHPSGLAAEVPFRLKVDLSVGLGQTLGGGTRDVPAAIAFGAVAFGAVAAAPLHEQANGAFVVGLAAHAHWPLNFGTNCIIRAEASECIRPYPRFDSAAVLVGWETAHTGKDGGARVLVGPAVFLTNLKRVFRADESQTLLGLQGRIDFTTMPTKHVGLLVCSQGATASPLRTDRYFLLTGGLGFRIQ